MKPVCCGACGRQLDERHLMLARPLWAMNGVVIVWRCTCEAYQCRVSVPGKKRKR